MTTRIFEEPRFATEVELTAALKDGFRELDRRGELSALLNRARFRWPRPKIALAAALCVAALGSLLSLMLYQLPGNTTADAATQTLYFETSRSGASKADVTWHRTAASDRLTLRFDVGIEPAAWYRVTMRHIVDGRAPSTIATVNTASSGGEVVLMLDGALLEPGDYDATLDPIPPGESNTTVRYTLRVDGS